MNKQKCRAIKLACCCVWGQTLWFNMYKRCQKLCILSKKQCATIAALRSCHLRVFLPFPALCAATYVHPVLSVKLHSSLLLLQGLIWLHVLDLMSSWPSGISLFASSISPCSRLTCFGDFTQLFKKKGGKKVISAAVWIRKRVEWIILTRFRMCCRWPGFCKAIKARNLKGVYWMQ